MATAPNTTYGSPRRGSSRKAARNQRIASASAWYTYGPGSRVAEGPGPRHRAPSVGKGPGSRTKRNPRFK
jgi:hypothetical protein